MRAFALAALALGLASCTGPGLPPSPGAETRAIFRKYGVADVIALSALNRLPLRAAALIAPDGRATRARDIVVTPATSLGENMLLGSAQFSPGSFGVATIPATTASSSGVPQAQAELLLMHSTASIPLPDRVAYRREWRRYRIRVRFGDPPGAVERQEIAAPAPPPG
jgi:hypothetical protein